MRLKEYLQPSERDRPALAVIFMLVGLGFLSFQDAWIKLSAESTSFWQIQTLRAIFNLTFLIVGAAFLGQLAVLRPKNIKLTLLRSGFLAITMIFFFSGSPFLSPAEMGAGLYTFPVFITLLSGPVLRERVGMLRYLAVAVAAIGAILIVRPFEAGFRPVQALPVVAGFFYACNVLVVRKHLRKESTFALAFAVAVVFLVMSLAGLLVLWIANPTAQTVAVWPFLLERWPDLTLWILVLAFVASATNLLGNLSLVQAYQSAEPSWLAPIDYCYLAMAVIWGMVLFRTPPEALTLLGMVLIAGAGLFTAWRERVKQR